MGAAGFTRLLLPGRMFNHSGRFAAIGLMPAREMERGDNSGGALPSAG
jgi:hypothetical protein